MKIRLKEYIPRRSVFRFAEKIPVQSFRYYIPKCGDCKHATEYVPAWIYPYGMPRCKVHHRKISPKGIICNDFERIGRLSR